MKVTGRQIFSAIIASLLLFWITSTLYGLIQGKAGEDSFVGGYVFISCFVLGISVIIGLVVLIGELHDRLWKANPTFELRHKDRLPKAKVVKR